MKNYDMVQTIQSISGRWKFEIHTKETINKTTPTVLLLAKEFQKGHNSIFPFTIEAIYYTHDPKDFVIRQPVFYLAKDEKLLLLQHNHTENIQNYLYKVIDIMKGEFSAIAFHEAKRI